MSTSEGSKFKHLLEEKAKLENTVNVLNKDIGHLKNKTERLEEELAKARNEAESYQDMKATIDRNRTQIDDLTKQNHQLLKTQNEIKIENEELKQQMQDLIATSEEEVDHLNQALEEVTQEANNHSAKIEEYQSQIQSLIQENEGLKIKSKEFELKFGKAQSENAQLQTALSDVQLKLQQSETNSLTTKNLLQENEREATKRAEKAELELSQTKTKLSNTSKLLSQIQSDWDILQEDKNKLELNLQMANKKNNNLEKQLEEIEETLKKLQNENGEAKGNAETLKDQCQKIENEHIQMKAELENKINELDKASVQIKNLTKTKEDLLQNQQMLEKSWQESQDEMSKLSETTVEQKRIIDAQNLENESLQKQITQYQEQIDALNAKINKQKLEFENETNVKKTIMEQQAESLKKQNEALEEKYVLEVQNCRSEIQHLEREIQKNMNIISQYESNIKSLQMESQNKDKKTKGLEDKVNELAKSQELAAKLSCTKSRLEKDIRHYRQIVFRLMIKNTLSGQKSQHLLREFGEKFEKQKKQIIKLKNQNVDIADKRCIELMKIIVEKQGKENKNVRSETRSIPQEIIQPYEEEIHRLKTEITLLQSKIPETHSKEPMSIILNSMKKQMRDMESQIHQYQLEKKLLISKQQQDSQSINLLKQQLDNTLAERTTILQIVNEIKDRKDSIRGSIQV